MICNFIMYKQSHIANKTIKCMQCESFSLIMLIYVQYKESINNVWNVI